MARWTALHGGFSGGRRGTIGDALVRQRSVIGSRSCAAIRRTDRGRPAGSPPTVATGIASYLGWRGVARRIRRGRRRDVLTKGEGWFLGPAWWTTCVPGMALAFPMNCSAPCYRSFAPPASREAIRPSIAGHPLGNGAAIFTKRRRARAPLRGRGRGRPDRHQRADPVSGVLSQLRRLEGQCLHRDERLFGPGAIAFHTRTKDRLGPVGLTQVPPRSISLSDIELAIGVRRHAFYRLRQTRRARSAGSHDGNS